MQKKLSSRACELLRVGSDLLDDGGLHVSSGLRGIVDEEIERQEAFQTEYNVTVSGVRGALAIGLNRTKMKITTAQKIQ